MDCLETATHVMQHVCRLHRRSGNKTSQQNASFGTPRKKLQIYVIRSMFLLEHRSNCCRTRGAYLSASLAETDPLQLLPSRPCWKHFAEIFSMDVSCGISSFQKDEKGTTMVMHARKAQPCVRTRWSDCIGVHLLVKIKAIQHAKYRRHAWGGKVSQLQHLLLTPG